VDVETKAGNSGELQFLMARKSSASCDMELAPWQLPFAVAEPSARGQFRLAQSGAQLGATRRATNVSKLTTRSGQLAFRIRLALRIPLLRYAHSIAASTAPSRGVEGS
jgi:hypothetical protein